MAAYYNEFDPFAAAWLRNLIKEELIADGEVDERSIVDVSADDLRGFHQCHFFAGIGGWSYALRLAGWPDDRPVWTGSCPCQPFSAAGKQRGFADDRHLWPVFHNLIAQCRPAVVFGEQVASKAGLEWFGAVRADLEGSGYAAAGVDLCAAGIGAPHIRQRLWWVADAQGDGRQQRRAEPSGRSIVGGCGEGSRLGHADGERKDSIGRVSPRAGVECQRDIVDRGRPSAPDNPWRDADWLLCRDGKWRPVEPGSKPLVDGLPRGMGRVCDPSVPIDAAQTAEARVGRLRGYGNAIVPSLAASVIKAFMETVT